jgi:murein DD-endopeptidase MepM/ murein hydrolase activator NlpD
MRTRGIIMTQYIDPTLLGIVPPMDLGRSSDLLPSSLPEEGISPFPLKLRVHNNSRPTVGSVGLFGARRGAGEGRSIRLHDGVDLLAPIGTPVFSVQSGTITFADDDQVRIEHVEGFRYVTVYSEVRNTKLTIFRRDRDDNIVRDASGTPIVDNVLNGSDMIGQVVAQGERIAEVKDFDSRDDHLHFEVRYPFEQTGNDRGHTLCVDPTWALYAWEKKMYHNDRATRNELRADRIEEPRAGERFRARCLLPSGSHGR